jgi:hypothetical protein
MEGGSFEMNLDDLHQTGSGWWSANGDREVRPWQWSPNVEKEPLMSSDVEENVVQTSVPGRLRPSLSSRVGRGSTFFDEMLEAEGTSSVWIARWGVLCAWIFFYQTFGALIMPSLTLPGVVASMVQCCFQAVYTGTYTSFLVIYARMRVMPPLDYVIGVVLYMIGYACFLSLYVLVLVMEAEDASHPSQVLYLLGSLFFLAGSALLVLATFPPPVPMVLRQLTIWEDVRARFSLCDQQSALFWGSVTFLLGSILFSLDSCWGLVNTESRPELLSPVCIHIGYALFTIGRLYFLWGSTTTDCGAFFQSEDRSIWNVCGKMISKVSVPLACCTKQGRSAKVAPSDDDTTVKSSLPVFQSKKGVVNLDGAVA